MIVNGWELGADGEPLRPREWVIDHIAPDSVAVRVAGCAVCEDDRAVATRAAEPTLPAPLPLGHEISGTIVAAGERASEWLGRSVIIPVVPPSHCCDGCLGRSACCTCGHTTATSESIGTGIASHVVVPTRGLCVVNDAELLERGADLADLSVIAEAVGAPYEAIARSELREGHVAVFLGASEPGAFGIQIAMVLGAYVIVLDTDDDRLERAEQFGAALALNIRGQAPRQIAASIQNHVRRAGLSRNGWRVYEMSGKLAEQMVARELVTPGGFIALVGQSNSDVNIRLRDLVNCVATVQGFCECMTGHLPEALELVLAGDIEIAPLVEHIPMSAVNEALAGITGEGARRPILIPDF